MGSNLDVGSCSETTKSSNYYELKVCASFNPRMKKKVDERYLEYQRTKRDAEIIGNEFLLKSRFPDLVYAEKWAEREFERLWSSRDALFNGFRGSYSDKEALKARFVEDVVKNTIREKIIHKPSVFIEESCFIICIKAKPNIGEIKKPKTEKPDGPAKGKVRIISFDGHKRDIPVSEFIKDENNQYGCFGDKKVRAKLVMEDGQKVFQKPLERGESVHATINIDGKETEIKFCVVDSSQNGIVVVITPNGDKYAVSSDRISPLMPEEKNIVEKTTLEQRIALAEAPVLEE